MATAFFLFNQSAFSFADKAIAAILISVSVVNCGVLFEHKTWVYIAEWLRITLYPAALITLTLYNGWSSYFIIGAAVYLLVSVAWFYQIPKIHAATA